MSTNPTQNTQKEGIIVETFDRLLLFIKGGHRMDFSGQSLDSLVRYCHHEGIRVKRIQQQCPHAW